RLVAVVQEAGNVLRDRLRDPAFLLVGFAGPEFDPEFDNDVRHHARPSYCSSLTCSSHSTALPSSCSCTAMCVIAVVGAAPCQCFSPGGNQTTSPGRISSIGPPRRCARPEPAVTISVWPSGCVCQAVRAPGSNVTAAPDTRAGA